MNIVFFTQDDPFYVKIFFEEFFEHYQHLSEIKAVVISKSMGKKSLYRLATQMLDFYGYRDFFLVGCKFVLLKILSQLKVKLGDSNAHRIYSVKQVAEAYGIDVIQRSDLNSDDFINSISKYQADLFISVASPIIWKENLIKTPKIDCINIHNAPLPKYRGMLPNFWQMYYGEKKAGITIHRIDIGIDTGAIIGQTALDIENKDTLDTLIKRTKRMGAHTMLRVIERYRSGRIEYKEMEGGGSYHSFPKREDVQEFRKRGGRLL